MSYGPRPKQGPTYVSRELTHREMPEFPRCVNNFTIYLAFPEPFESLLASMFLSEDGFTGYPDDDVKSSPGRWYGISWPCIDRDIPYYWRPMARDIRSSYWRFLWRKIRTLGKEKIFQSKLEMKMVWLAFMQPLPRISFSYAAERLIKDGCLEHREEQGVHMYYPLPAFADRIWEAKANLKANG